MSVIDQDAAGRETQNQRTSIGALATKVLSVQLGLFLIMYFLMPGYTVPFLNNFYGRVALIALLMWEMLGFAVLRNSRALPTLVAAGLFFVPLMLAPLFGPALVTIASAAGTIEDKGSVQAAQHVEGEDGRELVLNQSIHGSTMTVHFNSVTFKKSVSGTTSSPEATFVIVRFSVRNESRSPVQLDLCNVILVGVADGTVFQPDENATFALLRHTEIDPISRLQPGIQKDAASVFEIPRKQLKNEPELYLARETNWGSVRLFPKSIAKGAVETVSAENKKSVEKSEEKSSTEPTPDAPKIDNSTEVLNKAKVSDVEVSDSSKLVDQLLQSQGSNDKNSFDKTLSLLKLLPTPNVGNTVEAARLNKLGVGELKDQNYEYAAFHFEAAVKADPSDAKYLSNLGYAEIYNGDLDSAWRHLCASLQIDPSRSVAWGDLGILLAKQGRKDDSVAAFLIGNKVSKDGTIDFLKHLSSNAANDATVREASALALVRLTQSDESSPTGQSAR